MYLCKRYLDFVTRYHLVALLFCRPLVGRKGCPVEPKNCTKFVGHLVIEKLKFRKQNKDWVTFPHLSTISFVKSRLQLTFSCSVFNRKLQCLHPTTRSPTRSNTIWPRNGFCYRKNQNCSGTL